MAKGTISDFDSCPQSPTVGAYCSGTLKIVDFRESLSSPVLLQKQPISSTILKWNPHVPYWIATANQSGLEILDIRYNGRLPLLQIPHANISQLCWSRGNCDLVLAASKDRRINLWALGNDISHCRLNTMSLDYELEAFCADPIDPKQFVGLDANDSLVRFQLDQAYLSKLAPHQSDDPRFQELEGALYTRDPVALQQKLLEASKAETGSAWFRQVKQLILHSMSSTTPVPLDTNVIGSICIDDSGAAFYKLLMSSTAATQRTFVRRQSEQGSHLQALIDTLRLKIRVSELLAAQDANSLLRFTATLAQVISSGTEILSQQQLIVSIYLE